MSPSRPFFLNPQLFNPTLYSRLLKLWLTDLPLSAYVPTPVQTTRWFGVNASAEAKAAFDGECTSTALPALQSIAADKYPLPPFRDVEHDHGNYAQIAEPFIGQFTATETRDVSNDEAALALILLLDQMPRNIFRTQQHLIYKHYDRISRAVAYTIYSRHLDVCDRFRDSPPWQLWFYLPLMHSEALTDHELLREKVAAVQARMELKNDPQALAYVENFKNFESMHRRLIERFGRYPHRNRELGREETEEEKAYLKDGGETFGTS
ncbi:MAG: hypothetical protein Q9184_002701 [Pyrenodesmia sp. 2 TL-2023]